MIEKRRGSKGHLLLITEDTDLYRQIQEVFDEIFEILHARNIGVMRTLLKENSEKIEMILADRRMPVRVSDIFPMEEEEPVETEPISYKEVPDFSFKNEKVSSLSERFKNLMLPVLVLTSELSDQIVQEWTAQGITEFIQLPVVPGLLKIRVLGTLDLAYARKKIQELDYDELTGLYTRQAFYYYARQMMEEDPDASYNMIISDIEDFKIINARYGEDRGDGLLRYVGRCLSLMNSKDILFARYGGDQFVGLFRIPKEIHLEDTDPRMMMMGMNEMYKYAPVDRFTVKFGLYAEVDQEIPVSMMCDRTIMALRTIKHQYGKNMVFYNQEMQKRFVREQRIGESMEEALEQGQFQVYYQPKHAAGGEICGAEALIRWIHPKYGFMSPADFIPIFEKNGFITTLDEYVMNRVARDLTKWKADGLDPVPVSINASRKDILSPNCLKKIRKVLEDTGADPELLHMEVTESVYIEDAEELIPILREVRKLGIKVELDDFGSGYSSLGILSSLPLDFIKLDISFVRRLKEQEKVVEVIIDLAHSLGYAAIAEGVEEEWQLKRLGEMGCDAIQGYYFAKPMTCSEFEAYLKKSRKVSGI